ncbi:MAG: dihydrolipoyl dehydrogenase [Candidatus Woesearchaeota archaeon]
MVVGSMSVNTDLLVIGAGPGGYVAALRAARLGVDVMLVEKEKKLGGVCLNWGCIPTKAMIKASNYYSVLQELDMMGIKIKDYDLDFNKMKDWKNSIIEKLESGIKSLCKKEGIEIIEGKAVFKSKEEVRIEGKSDVNSVKFKNCIIATGSHSIEIEGFPFDHKHIVSDKDVLKLDEIPKNIAILGGGYIGTEMSTVFSKLGSKVHLIELGDRLIPMLDKEVTDVIYKTLLEKGVDIHLNTKATGYKENPTKIVTNKEEIEVDKILVVVGRKPNLDLDLEIAGVDLEDSFIKVDEYLKTSNPNIFAIGDVAGQPMLAHKASKQGKIAAEIIAGKKVAYEPACIPSVVFNDPELAQVGLSEMDAKEKGFDVKIGKFPFSSLGRAMIDRKTTGFVKLVGDKKTDLLLGMQAVGPNVSEMVSEIALAIELGATMQDVALTIHPHPTNSESLMEAAEAASNASVHIFKK